MKKLKKNILFSLGMTFLISLTVVSFEELFIVQPKLNVLSFALADASSVVKATGESGVDFAEEIMSKATGEVGMPQSSVKIDAQPYSYTLSIDGVLEANTLFRKLLGKDEIEYKLYNTVNSDIR